MKIQLVDPSAFTPPYDHALSAALARRGADVELLTSRFLYGPVPEPDGYEVRECFYRRSRRARPRRTRPPRLQGGRAPGGHAPASAAPSTATSSTTSG